MLIKPIQALTLATALSFGTPLMTGCSRSSRPTDESSMVTTRSTVAGSLPPAPPPNPAASGPARLLAGDPHAVLAATPPHDNSLLVLTSILAALGAISTVYLTWLHLKLRREQAYAANRAAGLTLPEDIRRIEQRLETSAGDRDNWNIEFLTDLGKVARNGLLRPAKCRETDIVDLMNLRKRQLPVISTVVAPSGAGKSRMVEGVVHALYHDRSGRHYTSPDYNANDRLFRDIDPSNLLCFRLNLGQLTHTDAEPMFHYLMQKADRCTKEGGKCLVIIDDAHFLYRPNGHASAARLIHLIDGWTDGQMKDLKGLWGIAMTPESLYDELFQQFPSRRRRFERYDMTVLSGGRLRAVIDEILDDWEEKLTISIPADVRERVVELMAHPKNDMANPYACLNLLDRMQSRMGPLEKVMTTADVHRSFARVYRLPEVEVAQWSLYPQILKAIEEELLERFRFLGESEHYKKVLAMLAQRILKAWKQSDQSFQQLVIPEHFFDETLSAFYAVIRSNPVNRDAQDLLERMTGTNGDAGSRAHRRDKIRQLPSANSLSGPSSERRPAASA